VTNQIWRNTNTLPRVDKRPFHSARVSDVSCLCS